MGKFDKIDEMAAIRIELPRWMLEDMRERAKNRDMEVTEWIRLAVSHLRNTEDGLD